MAKKKVTAVKEHPRKVPRSKLNPKGITTVDKHIRRLDGTFLDIKEIEKIVKNGDLKKVIFPSER